MCVSSRLVAYYFAYLHVHPLLTSIHLPHDLSIIPPSRCLSLHHIALSCWHVYPLSSSDLSYPLRPFLPFLLLCTAPHCTYVRVSQAKKQSQVLVAASKDLVKAEKEVLKKVRTCVSPVCVCACRICTLLIETVMHFNIISSKSMSSWLH